ncbi:sterol desaturase family protein [Alcaligenaceae bacterium]|nr:sterol desaturase family protein [Alcaligenaceae bacterium]
MEIVDSPMNDRQRKFRALYRERVAGWYNGYLHAAIIYLIGGIAMYIYIANITDVRWWEWLTVPTVFLGAQWFEYVMHRYVLHRPRKSPFLRALYTRHTLMHHQFFTEEESRFADHMDWRVTLFPPFALVVLTILMIPQAIALGWLVSPNVGWLFIATGTGSYLFYEVMHFACHIDDNWFVRNMPLVNTSRRHHAAHHNQSIMMEINMGVVLPIWDWVYGTSDLDRGLVGQLFNGYNTKYIKKDLRKTYRTPKPQFKRSAAGAGN